MTVGELLQRMPADEFQRWKVLERFDPWGQRRDDWRIALLSAQIAALAGAKKSVENRLPDPLAFKAIDCILEFNTDLPENPEDIDPIDAEAERAKRAAEIEKTALRMFGVGAQHVVPKKIIQEHDKPKGD
jgi:hypothetical protein